MQTQTHPLFKSLHFQLGITQPNPLGRLRSEPIKIIQRATRTTIIISATTRDTDPKKGVVITGMGLVSVFGNDVDTFYDKLLTGEGGIGLIDRFDASEFPTRFGGEIRNFKSDGYINGKNDRRLDDRLRYCVVAGKKALEHADLGGDNNSLVCGFSLCKF